MLMLRIIIPFIGFLVGSAVQPFDFNFESVESFLDASTKASATSENQKLYQLICEVVQKQATPETNTAIELVAAPLKESCICSENQETQNAFFEMLMSVIDKHKYVITDNTKYERLFLESKERCDNLDFFTEMYFQLAKTPEPNNDTFVAFLEYYQTIPEIKARKNINKFSESIKEEFFRWIDVSLTSHFNFTLSAQTWFNGLRLDNYTTEYYKCVDLFYRTPLLKDDSADHTKNFCEKYVATKIENLMRKARSARTRQPFEISNHEQDIALSQDVMKLLDTMQKDQYKSAALQAFLLTNLLKEMQKKNKINYRDDLLCLTNKTNNHNFTNAELDAWAFVKGLNYGLSYMQTKCGIKPTTENNADDDANMKELKNFFYLTLGLQCGYNVEQRMVFLNKIKQFRETFKIILEDESAGVTPDINCPLGSFTAYKKETADDGTINNE